MNDRTIRMVLFPRYTAVIGSSPLYSAPFNVKKFAKAILTAWAGRGLGASAPNTTIVIEQSADLGTWHSAGSVSPAVESEKSAAIDLLDLEWARAGIAVVPPTGTTVWAVGAFVLREGVQP